MSISWCYSYNGENFVGDFATKEDAIGEAKDYASDEQNTIYVGQENG